MDEEDEKDDDDLCLRLVEGRRLSRRKKQLNLNRLAKGRERDQKSAS